MTSDELVFKGTVNRRMGRELAREASQNSIHTAAREPARDAIRDIAQEPPHDPSRPMEWKYRGRSETEAATAEPIPAPTGVPAQRDEGFQRFYKAVVSPTHVRVTAGGRIVPNTRGPPSPTVKRASDSSSVIESQSMLDPAVVNKAPVVSVAPVAPVAPVNFGQSVPVLPQLLTGYPSGFQPIQAPVSFVPMALGTQLPPGFSFAPTAVNPAAMGPLAPGTTLKDMHNAKAADDEKQGKVKPPVPEPFYYNGQIMYPVGTFQGSLGNQMVPIHMVGIPHGVATQLPGHYLQPQPAPTSAAATAPAYTPSAHSLSGIPVVNHIVPANASFNAGTAPPISSIRPSDITKKQIASFKQNLKYHEDQLQYNRHQIDEKEMEQRIQIIKGHIHSFESTLKTQLEYEEAHFKTTQGKEDKTPSQPVAVAEERRVLSQPLAQTATLGYGAPATKQEMNEAINRRIGPTSYGLNTSVAEGGKAISQSSVNPAPPGVNGLQTLPSDAALAPIFQPRGYASTWTSSKYAKEMKAYKEAEKRLLATETKSLEHLRASDQRSVSQPFFPMGPRAKGNLSVSENSARSGSNGAKQQAGFGVPYLLGTLPKGVNPRTARDQDYVYKRPLTDEERRARFLYWGQAPKSAVRGLPKYDGKHFYPPSPVKERSAEPARENDCRTTESNGDPFRPMTPVQRGDSNGVLASEDNCTSGRLTRTVSFETQVNSGAEDFMTGGAPDRCREDSLDASSIGSIDRRLENPRYEPEVDKFCRRKLTMECSAKLWQAMLKKGPTSSALSSTTAQGYLPHYTAHAAASLTPSLIANQLVPARDTSGKLLDAHDLGDNGGVLLSAPEKRGENCPPGGVSSLEDQFKHLTADVAGRRNLTSAFSM